jgi:hypothetical protein
MQVVERGGGRSVLTWDAQPEYGFPTASGQVIHGGMVTTILDSAMGQATWSVLGDRGPAGGVPPGDAAWAGPGQPGVRRAWLTEPDSALP